MEELFAEPIGSTRGLNGKLKIIAAREGCSYARLKKAVLKALDTPGPGGHTLGDVWARRRRIHRVLKLYGKADQRSDAWLQKRSEMITASEVTKAFASATPSARKELLMRKVYPEKGCGGGMSSMTACLWGTQFEPIAKGIYEAIQGGDVVDTTCVVHPVYPFLGASPDGIVLMDDPMDLEWGKLVEFKCPISRAFTQTSTIPDSYYHQMQMQMECTGINICDYVEMQFKTCTQTAWRASTAPYKGVLAVYDNGKIVYKDEDDPLTPLEWKQTLVEDDVRMVFWTLENIRIEQVPRDIAWMDKHLEELRAFWAIVQECREDPAKMAQYMPPTAPLEAPSALPEAPDPVPPPVRGSLPGRTMKLNLDDDS